MNKQTKFIAFIVLVVVIIGGIGTFFALNSSKQAHKLDAFAQALTSQGAIFYGAFWCPHCQEQKAEFSASKEYLPYTECSTPDGQKQNQICKDKKIEGYPAWTFKDGITINSDKDPFICEIKTETSVEPEICKQRSSAFYRTWLFPDYGFSIKSPTDPVKQGVSWQFPVDAQTSGKLPLTFLAEQIKFTLPQ